ncbi:hypothetical protein [Streptococcus marimammalium]|uniref:hypothetical protein n=1 Tax=Streptococcus marimammalium TaxID=269666 RepID=UPI000365C399|nr:hypothetical protein [Streptococcus marimammalium]
MKKIIGIYDANAGLVGEFKYVFEKVFYKKHCALCDITHGLSFTAKKEWLNQVETFPLPIETFHLNEIDQDLKKFVDKQTPCIVYSDGDCQKIIMTNEELSSFSKEPDHFFKQLTRCLTKEGLIP